MKDDPRWEGCICLQDEHHKDCPAIATGKCHFQNLYDYAWQTPLDHCSNCGEDNFLHRGWCNMDDVNRLREAWVRLRQQLAEAANEINCSGTVAHRIRVMKKEYRDLIEEKNEEIKQLQHLLHHYGLEPIKEPHTSG